ncbi:putative molybdenum utilization protein ModD [Desulfosporosinus orientis DSM 765]|uniref:Putative pyrophosphorylase ModD n=1 Tax=Desulfosporosinus orientis (strain ATCC 19365 / DSM 765 / NCIMB 8382 / VKM B-1628 / Singapore I) TaxID=768706 RepID=G7W7P2_DESOD|nr:ModD protein [Desulfosporosinus orientis]AET66107.1 putative molybdenum utilization protein ModD [Desulfosporosinus orientis DSM 765]
MLYISDESIERWIKEDVPYIDLTTLTLDIGDIKGKISFKAREFTVLSGVEEVLRIFNKLGITEFQSLPSGSVVDKGDTFIEAVGSAGNLHLAWKVSLNVLEYCSGIATRTKKMVEKAKGINPKTSVVATRKSFPGTKELSIKSIIAGGAYPHRLGLSETILIFKQHINFLGDVSDLVQMIGKIKEKVCEKKVIVEVEGIEDARLLIQSGVDGLQFDKVPAEDLKNIVEEIRRINPRITLLGAGGINEGNIEEYARTGIDAIVTTSMYFGKPSDIGVTIGKF